MSFCQSCGIPTAGPGGQGRRGDYCENCAEADGRLKPRETVHKGISDWLALFSGEVPKEELAKRADSYLAAMPAWNK